MTTYYVDGAVGNDSNAGTSEGAGNAWATIGKAFATIAASDTVYIKASATYTEDCSLITVAISSNWSRYIGYTSTPGDGGRINWTAATTQCVTSALSNVYHYFENIVFTGATYCIFSTTWDQSVFRNCTFQNSSSHNVSLDNNNTFIHCESLNSGARGIDNDNSLSMIACKILNGTLEGAYQVSGSFQFFNIIEGGGSGSVVFQGFTAYMIGNILRAPATHTSSMTSGSASVGVNMNNIYYGGSATTYSINGSAAPNPTAVFWGNNVHKNITSAYNQDYSARPELQVGQGDIIDPSDAQIDWTDPDNDDYTIASADSVLIDAGITPGLL